MSWFYPQPPDAPIRLPRQFPRKVVPSFIGESGQVLNLLMHHGSGSRVRDYSPYGNHGTIHGAEWVSSEWGWALYFDGNSYVRIPDSPSLDITTPFTVLAWVYLTKTGVDRKIFHHQSPGIKLSVYSNDKVEVEIRNPSDTPYSNRNVTGGTILKANRWYLVGGWWDGSEIRSIVNGEFERPYSYTGDIGVTSNDAGIGVEFDWSKYFFNGYIATLMLFNRALSGEEVKAYYESTRSIFGA